MREKETVTFPMQEPKVGVTSAALAAHIAPETELEQQVHAVLQQSGMLPEQVPPPRLSSQCPAQG